MVNEKAYGRGKGRTKKSAEQKAAYETILLLRQEVVHVFEKYKVQGFKSFAKNLYLNFIMELPELSDQTAVEKVMLPMRSAGY